MSPFDKHILTSCAPDTVLVYWINADEDGSLWPLTCSQSAKGADKSTNIIKIQCDLF